MMGLWRFKEARPSFLKNRSKKLLLLTLGLSFGAPCYARRVVSLNLCTDQLAVLLAPEEVVGLEPLARDPALSFVAPQAARLPRVRADAEAVLALKPDLVLAGTYGAQTTVALLRARGLHVAQFADPTDFTQVAEQVTQVASLLGKRLDGARIVADMQRRLAAMPRRHATAVLWQAGGWSAGPGSFGDAVLRAAGLTNLGTGGRIGLEALLAAHPDLLVTEQAARFPSLATDLAWHPALRAIRHSVVPSPLLVCEGPFSVGAVEELAR